MIKWRGKRALYRSTIDYIRFQSDDENWTETWKGSK